jgi:hypothetical protein
MPTLVFDSKVDTGVGRVFGRVFGLLKKTVSFCVG